MYKCVFEVHTYFDVDYRKYPKTSLLLFHIDLEIKKNTLKNYKNQFQKQVKQDFRF